MGLTRKQLVARAGAGALGAAGIYGLVDRLAPSPARAAVHGPLPPEQHVLQDVPVVHDNGVEVLVPPRHHQLVTLRLHTGTSKQQLAAARATLEHELAALESQYAPTPSGLGITVAWGLPYFRHYVAKPAAALPARRRPRVEGEGAQGQRAPRRGALPERPVRDDPRAERRRAAPALGLVGDDPGGVAAPRPGPRLLEAGQHPPRLRRRWRSAAGPACRSRWRPPQACPAPSSSRRPPSSSSASRRRRRPTSARCGSRTSRRSATRTAGRTATSARGRACTCRTSSRTCSSGTRCSATPSAWRRSSGRRSPRASGTLTVRARAEGRGDDAGQPARLPPLPRDRPQLLDPDDVAAARGRARAGRDAVPEGNGGAPARGLQHARQPVLLERPPGCRRHERRARRPACTSSSSTRPATTSTGIASRWTVSCPTGRRCRSSPNSRGQGINAVLKTTHRQNFLVPPRRHRSFPLVEFL